MDSALLPIARDVRPTVELAVKPRRTRCLACGGNGLWAPYPARLSWLVRCSGCGLEWIDPQPPDAELDAIYDADYFQTFGESDDPRRPYRTLLRARADWFLMFLNQAEAQVARGRLLDVGSGVGELLLAARDRGWEAVGVEPNRAALQRCERTVVEMTWPVSIEELPSEEGGFDVVLCSDVLEHLRDPANVLRDFCARLKPGGLLILTTVNAQGLVTRILGARWFHYHRDHLWYFTRGSLVRLAQEAGFDRIRCGVPWKPFHADYILNVLGRRATGRRRSPLGRWLERMRRTLGRRIVRIPEGLHLAARRPLLAAPGLSAGRRS